MITARQEPRLVLVSITYEDDRLTFEAPGMDQLVLQSKLPSSNRIHNCRYATWGLGDPGTRGPAPGPVSFRLLPALCSLYSSGSGEIGKGSISEKSSLGWDPASVQLRID